MKRAKPLLGIIGIGALVWSAPHLAHQAVFPGADTPIPEGVPGVERLELGAGLAAAWVPAKDARATAVYFHATNQAAADAIWFARDLAARGVSVCLPEHRGYGGLPGEPTFAA